MPPDQLIIFVKAPRAGLVKTRLAHTLGAQEACDAYRTMAETLLASLRPIPNVQLRYSPDDAAGEITPWQQPGWTAKPQGRGDLGRKLDNAFQEAFALGARRVVIIGSDCPYVTSADIQQAWTALGDHDLVLGPAQDGGYWLIGLRLHAAALFDNIAWSTKDVLTETLERADAARLRKHLLRELTDVDTAQEWQEFLLARFMPKLAPR